MDDRPARVYRRIRALARTGPYARRNEPTHSHTDGKSPCNRPVPAWWAEQHEARILAEQARVQAELVHHPEECPQRNARRQRMADRRALALYLARQGGQAPRRWLRVELGWDSLRLEAAVKFPAWFVREGTALRLTPEGWNAVPKETPS